MTPRIVLASGSPRRAEILRMMGLAFEVDPAAIAEDLREGESPTAGVERLAAEKASEVASRHPDAIVIAGDTVVVVEGQVLGKPIDAADATAMLLSLSARTHMVATGIAVVAPGGESRKAVEVTQVTFGALSPADARSYVATDEPLDKAGAYGIQGRGASLVRSIEGDYFTVVGMPVYRLGKLLAELGFPYDFRGPLRPTSTVWRQ